MTTFSPAAFKRDKDETRAKNVDCAKVLEVRPCYISQWLDGTRKPTDREIRALACMFTVIRAQSMANNGSFTFNAKGIRLLRRAIAEMQRSIVPSTRPQPKEESVEESACAS